MMSQSPERSPQVNPSSLEEAHAVIDGLTLVIKRLHEESQRDVLIPTMLNKRATERLIESHISAHEPFGLFLVDLNRFKHVNDRLGHAAGDQLLISLGAHLYEGFRRQTDRLGVLATSGRIGGDEFVIITEFSQDDRRDTNPYIQMDKTYDLLREIEADFIEQNDFARSLGVGFSIGSALFDPQRPLDASTLLGQADEAMYEEKGSEAR